ncbi:MAG: F0F1 ATP synthase subunit epsilon [Dehalococcoidia bacterium]|jgi:F-type H+-transporting ATPase subunit epsilon|nr:F0F1 ATP synthase subunit epsilon [Dehalococcoidia bacterium]
MPLKLEIITAERVVYSADDVREVVLPGVEGELAVLPKHAPLMTMLRPGIMRIVHEDREEELAVHGGFLEVRDDRVTILADAAERAEEIDVARAEAARRRAQELMAQRRRDEMEFAAAQAALQRALVRLKLAERLRRRRGR